MGSRLPAINCFSDSHTGLPDIVVVEGDDTTRADFIRPNRNIVDNTLPVVAIDKDEGKGILDISRDFPGFSRDDFNREMIAIHIIPEHLLCLT